MTITNGSQTWTFSHLDESTTRIDGTRYDGQPIFIDREVATRTLSARIKTGWRPTHAQ